jgi:cyclic pyranopterin monophosphate synthase
MNVDNPLTHIGAQGRAKMVDVTEKAPTVREAQAEAFISMAPETLRLVLSGGIKKGDVLAVAQVAGIMAAKRTHELIPMCHPLMLTGADIAFEPMEDPSGIRIQSTVRVKGETGVEMEALTAASVAALTIYDMAKAVEKGMTIENLRLIRKSGGKSGDYRRTEV